MPRTSGQTGMGFIGNGRGAKAKSGTTSEQRQSHTAQSSVSVDEFELLCGLKCLRQTILQRYPRAGESIQKTEITMTVIPSLFLKAQSTSR